MPFSELNGVRIHYETRGVGVPLLLLNHIGASRLGWRDEFLSELEAHFTLILPDHRGTGNSDKPDVPYTIRDLARDIKGVLDTVAYQRVHVLGLSMGGAVAQELVFAAPQRIDHLILVATFCGPRKSVPPDPAVLEHFAGRERLPRVEQIKAILPVYYSRAFIDTNETLLIRLTAQGTEDTPRYSLARHTEAVRQFDSYDQLIGIRHPTLVIHGTADAIIPRGNADILVERLPNARLEVIPGAGHVPMTEQPQSVAHLVRQFCLSGAYET